MQHRQPSATPSADPSVDPSVDPPVDRPARQAVRQEGRHLRDRGQATTEYALILLAAALVGVLVIGWATAGGGAAAIGRLFDRAIESVIEQL
jgi:hypothetical protein